MTRRILAATVAFAVLSSGQAMAWQTPEAAPAAKPVPAPAPENKAPNGTTAEERANTARLNAEQAAQARTDNIIYAQEVSAAQQQVAHDQQVYADETAAYEAEKARVAAMSAEERLKWEADAAACKAGDKTRCAPPAPVPPK